ncbi:hypothetical protein G9A89_007081 [Geosiphon pyriformis]|nr:hypothetical protein G9A89_007081 [Geosiphon pyriformis]
MHWSRRIQTAPEPENEAMFSEVALDKKCPITAIYMEATINNTPIKLILDNGSTGSIIMLQLVNQLGFKVDHATMSQIITADRSTKLPHSEIDSFPFEINDIVIPTKVLVIDTTQYQALVGNNWLTKANATLDWTTQELLINYNDYQTRIPATCGHFQKPRLPAIPTWTSEERSKWNQLECSVCKKKLSSMTAYSVPDENPRNPTHYYCNCCNKEKYELLPRGCDWNNILGKGGTYNATCQYTILICDWVKERTPFEAHYPHDKDELYNTAQAKEREGTAEEIQHWKESAKVTNKVASYNMFDPVDEF